ncbi:MAG: alcohol dehydrogenase catalytic domain-containing protein [Propionicimonas sp.]|nr:alcohol dehydrogenase catalytic domain-containing protein [Propionicimonas sp.]
MKQVAITEPGRVEVREVEVPRPGPGEVLLRVLWGGICGSDLGTYRGTFLYASYPRVPGHEFSAEVVEAGAGVDGLEPGTVVTANPYFNCGHCYACRRGFVNCCQQNQTMGAQRDGAFSRYLTMPADRVYRGGGVDARTLALVEPFAISHHAVKRAAVHDGDRVLVIGAGAIGSFAAIAASLAGASVWVADIDPAKLEGLDSFGVAGVIAGGDGFAAGVAAVAPDGFDVCVEAVGAPATFGNAIAAAAHRGRVVQVGVGKQSLDFFYTVLQTKELDVFGSRNALREDFVEVIDLIGSGRVDLAPIVSATYPVADAPAAFASAGSGRKTLLDFAD